MLRWMDLLKWTAYSVTRWLQPRFTSIRLQFDRVTTTRRLRLVWFFDFIATTTSQTLSLLFTGSVSLGLPTRVDLVMTFRVLRGLAPPYLDQLVRVADLPSGRRLRSSSSYQLHVPTYRLAAVGRRSFLVAASLLWNSLPPDVQSSASLSVFRYRLKTFLFRKSFPGLLL